MPPTRLQELYAFTLQDFQDACIVAQLERMRQRVRAHRQNLLACAGHIDGFIRHLCLYTGEDRRRRAVLRFQQKLTTEFCIQLWEAMKQRAERKGQDTEPLIGRAHVKAIGLEVYPWSNRHNI